MGRRYANLVCKKADVDMNKRAGELTDDEVMWYFIFLALYLKYTVNYTVVIYQYKHWGKFTVWDVILFMSISSL